MTQKIWSLLTDDSSSACVFVCFLNQSNKISWPIPSQMTAHTVSIQNLTVYPESRSGGVRARDQIHDISYNDDDYIKRCFVFFFYHNVPPKQDSQGGFPVKKSLSCYYWSPNSTSISIICHIHSLIMWWFAKKMSANAQNKNKNNNQTVICGKLSSRWS